MTLCVEIVHDFCILHLNMYSSCIVPCLSSLSFHTQQNVTSAGEKKNKRISCCSVLIFIYIFSPRLGLLFIFGKAAKFVSSFFHYILLYACSLFCFFFLLRLCIWMHFLLMCTSLLHNIRKGPFRLDEIETFLKQKVLGCGKYFEDD